MKHYLHKNLIECGCDEVGRGCIAGAVYAAAVIWPHGKTHQLLRDSKKLKESDRKVMSDFIKKHATAFHIASVSPQVIDEINILQASIRAMHIAIDGLGVEPEFLLIDGNKFANYKNIPHETIVKGDDKFIAIAAASILAKVARDEEMIQQGIEYPQYDWAQNKGYGTKKHVEAIRTHGYTPLHRKSFHVKALQKTLFNH